MSLPMFNELLLTAYRLLEESDEFDPSGPEDQARLNDLNRAYIKAARELVEFCCSFPDPIMEGLSQLEVLCAEDANEHPTDAATVERQHPSQGTRLQPGRVVGEDGCSEPGETGVEGC